MILLNIQQALLVGYVEPLWDSSEQFSPHNSAWAIPFLLSRSERSLKKKNAL